MCGFTYMDGDSFSEEKYGSSYGVFFNLHHDMYSEDESAADDTRSDPDDPSSLKSLRGFVDSIASTFPCPSL
jgi:hypothetical protein